MYTPQKSDLSIKQTIPPVHSGHYCDLAMAIGPVSERPAAMAGLRRLTARLSSNDVPSENLEKVVGL